MMHKENRMPKKFYRWKQKAVLEVLAKRNDTNAISIITIYIGKAEALGQSCQNNFEYYIGMCMIQEF